MKVLLVEDYADSAFALKSLLEQQGNQVRCATTLVAALEACKADKYDVILLDLVLPDSSGLATFDVVDEAASKTPIVIFSALDDKALAIEAISRGAQDYIVKPAAPDDLLDRLVYATKRARR